MAWLVLARSSAARSGLAGQGWARRGRARQGAARRGSFSWERFMSEAKTEKPKGREPKTRAEAGTRELVARTVHIRGLTDIMFDRYPGDNDTKLEPWQKLYLAGDEG